MYAAVIPAEDSTMLSRAERRTGAACAVVGSIVLFSACRELRAAPLDGRAWTLHVARPRRAL